MNNKRKILTLLPTILCFGVLNGCKGGDTPTPPTPGKTLTSITVTPSMNSYFVGDKFESSDIGSFQANYSDGSTVAVKEGYTSNPTLPYTFKDSDVTNGKDFNFTYEGKTDSFHVKVIDPTYPIDFEFNPTSDKEIDVDSNSTRQVQIKFKNSSYERNYKSIAWDYDSEYIEKIEDDNDKIFKFKAIKDTSENTPTELKVRVENKIGNTKEEKCLINISDLSVKPMFYYQSWYSYLKEENIDAPTTLTFETVLNGSNSVRYFGMSNYAGTEPYFTIGDSSKQISVSNISINGTKLEESKYSIINYGSGTNKYNLVLFNPSYTTKDTKIKIECTINSQLTEGIWAYFGY